MSESTEFGFRAGARLGAMPNTMPDPYVCELARLSCDPRFDGLPAPVARRAA